MYDKRFYVLYDAYDRVRAIGFKDEIIKRMRWTPKQFSNAKYKSDHDVAGKRWHFEVVDEDEDDE